MLSALRNAHGLYPPGMAQADILADHLRQAGVGYREVKRRTPLPVFCMNVSAMCDQQLGGIFRVILNGKVQGCPVEDIRPVHIRPEAQQPAT